jgi:deazaflavin-dependent oxidoreductase (nitroreductase family)
MNDRLIKWFMSINSFLIRGTAGRLGSKLGTQTILILHTLGRKSGLDRATPIAYFDYEDKYLLVASNWGRSKQADWFLNLRGQPRASVEVSGKRVLVLARETQGEEYSRLWEFATQRHPPYLDYQKLTARHIPILLLEPV